MSHNEESLLMLADAYARVNFDDGWDRLGIHGDVSQIKRAALQLAIREVLEARQKTALDALSAFGQADENLARAEKAEAIALKRWEALQRCEEIEAECERLRKDAERLKGLRTLCGFVQDGSNETVKLCQDDATMDWFVSAGTRNWFGSSFSAAIDAAIEQERK